MSRLDRLKEFRRILVALDASPASLAALDLAVDLASRHKAELLGVYVEDINLLRSAQIPFSREFGHFSGISQDIDSSRIERELQAQARHVERHLSSIAQKANLHWSFQKVRGIIHGELLEIARDTDLIIMGKTGWSRGRQLGSTARNVAVKSTIQSLIMLRKVRPGTPLMVVYDRSEASQKALLAAQLVSSEDVPIIVLIVAPDPGKWGDMEDEVLTGMEPLSRQVEFHHAADIDGERLSHMAMVSGCDVIVMPVESSSFDPESLVKVLNETDCAVLLVR